MTRLRAVEPVTYAAGADSDLWTALGEDLPHRVSAVRIGFAVIVRNEWIALNDDPELTAAEKTELLMAFTIDGGGAEHHVRRVVAGLRQLVAEPGYRQRRDEREAKRRLLSMGGAA
jgi:hypothetical protein